MKVLELVESAAAGVGRHVLDLAGGLLARGHEVHVLYSDMRSDQVFADALRNLRGYSSFSAFQVSMQRWPHRTDFHAARVFRRYVRSHGPFDLVHCHSTKAGLIGRAGLAGTAIKRLYTPHMFFTMQPSLALPIRRAVAMLEAVLSRLCHGVVTVSREEYSHAIEMGISSAKVSLIPNGVALDTAPLCPVKRNAIRRTWGVGEADICVGFVGRLATQKSPEILLRSFATLLRRPTIPSVRLVVIGDGPLGGALRQLTKELNIENGVDWLGMCDARPLMSAFDVLALTSESEGHPLVVLEAMARGIPIVATAVGGIPETVHDRVNGFVTPIGGVSEIADALELLVNDPALREQMGHASLTLSRNFSIDRMVDQTIALYEQVISGARKAPVSSDLKVAALR